MIFVPSQAEAAQANKLENQPSNLDDTALAVPGSEWKEIHLKALRVVLLDDLPLDRLFPAEYLPSENHPIYKDLKPELLRPSEDDLKSWSVASLQFDRNRFFSSFSSLADVMKTRPAHVEGTLGDERDPSPESDLSSSSQEDENEEPSKDALIKILQRVALYYVNKPIKSRNKEYRVQTSGIARSMKIPLGTKSTVTAINDGGIYITHQGKYTGSDRYGTVPLVSVEAKRRHAGGVRRPAGETEIYTPHVFAQEVAELLGQAIGHNAQLNCPSDQEAFLLNIHGTRVKLIAARFTAEYLSCIKSPVMPVAEKLWVRRSVSFDLKSKLGRAGVLQLCIGLMDYLISGHAEMSLLKKIFE